MLAWYSWGRAEEPKGWGLGRNTVWKSRSSREGLMIDGTEARDCGCTCIYDGDVGGNRVGRSSVGLRGST